MKVDLNGKVAVVTGGGGFLGSKICEVLAENGAIVFVQSYNPKKADAVVDRIRNAGGQAYPLPGDIRDKNVVEQLAKQVYDQSGRIDILVNNAGINSSSEYRTEINGFNDEIWDSIMSVDMNGVYNCSKHFSKYMVEARSGRIINISSVAGVVALRKQCAFVAAKSGVLGLTRAMAAELGQFGILVNAIAPGSITNADWKSVAGNAVLESLLSHIPLGRQGSDAEIASVVAFLSAPEASYISGAMITVDGGWTCGFMRDW